MSTKNYKSSSIIHLIYLKRRSVRNSDDKRYFYFIMSNLCDIGCALAVFVMMCLLYKYELSVFLLALGSGKLTNILQGYNNSYIKTYV